MSRLNELRARAKQRHADYVNDMVILGTTADDITSGRAYLRRGSTGDAVRFIQQQLGVVNVDGVFGPDTEAAVKAYQAYNRLTPDGVVGKNTYVALAFGGNVSGPSSSALASSKLLDPYPTVMGADRGLFDDKCTYYPNDVLLYNGIYYKALRKVEPSGWFNKTISAKDIPGRSVDGDSPWQAVKQSATGEFVPLPDRAILGADDIAVFGAGYAHGLDVLGAGAPASASAAAKHAQIAATQTKVQKSATQAQKAISEAVAHHANHPPKTHAGAIKAAQVAAARASLVAKKINKHVGGTKILGDVFGATPSKKQSMATLTAAAKSVTVSAQHAAEAAKAHAKARATANAKASAKQKALKQTKVFTKKTK